MLDQDGVVGSTPFRLVDIPDYRLDRLGRGLQRRDARLLEADLVVINAAHEAIHRSGNGDAPLDIGHIGAAVQRVAGAIEFFRYREGWPTTIACGDVIAYVLQVTGCLLGEDVEQHRVHFQRGRLQLGFSLVACRDGQYGSIGISVGERIGTSDQQADIRGRLRTHFELFDEFRDRARRLPDKSDHWRGADQRLVDQAIQQIFDRPGVLSDSFGAHHSAAALQGVERPPDGDEGIEVVR